MLNAPKIENKIIAQVFNSTSATYKYYWFIAIIDLLLKNKSPKINLWEIIISMVSEAWYPIHYFKLSFGKSDSFYTQILEIQQHLNIAIDANKATINKTILKNIDNTSTKALLNIFTLNVPYRFLSPWIKYSSDKQVTLASQKFENNCLYAINGDYIEINPAWEQYLIENYAVLKDFAYWNLNVFLQKRNPNVPNLSSKLLKPETRESLNKQRRFWNDYLDTCGTIPCIYTGKVLQKGDFHLDHFIPWSFVTHNLNWNLLPADACINISKSNQLPPLDIFLQPFARIQQAALKSNYNKNPNNSILEDYLTICDSLSELIHMPEEDFYITCRKTFAPMTQIAENMGFRYWKNSIKTT